MCVLCVGCVRVCVYAGNESDIKSQARPGRALQQPLLSPTGGRGAGVRTSGSQVISAKV